MLLVFGAGFSSSLAAENPRHSREHRAAQSRSLFPSDARPVDGRDPIAVDDLHFHPDSGPTVTASSVNFGKVSVGSSSTMSVTFTFSGTVTLEAPVVLTQGATGLDFANAGTGTCAAATYNSGNTCTVNVTFTPASAGPRYGAAVLKNSSGGLLATGYVYGTGLGPQTVFLPGTESTLFTGFQDPEGVAVDASGNVYIADYGSPSGPSAVYKETLSGGSYTQATIGTGFMGAFAVALDGAGNVYVADYSAGSVYIETLLNGSYTQSTVASGFVHPDGVAVDGVGNVYIADFGCPYCTPSAINGGLYKETLSNGSYAKSTIGSGLDTVSGVMVDGNGNVYAADFTDYQVSGTVFKEKLSGGSYTQSTISTNFVTPTGVAMDAGGNLYVTDDNNASGSGGKVYKETPSSGGYTQTVLVSAIVSPEAVALDASGNLFVPDFNSANVFETEYAQPPSRSFATTNVFSTSTDSPKTVQVANIGNTTLTFTGLSYPTDFPEAGGDANACTGSTSLSPAQQCDLPIDFTPQGGGALSENVTLTDNTLNVTGAAQSIGVTGTGVALNQTITFAPPAQVRYGVAPLNLSSYGSASSGLAVSFQVISGPASLTGSILSITGAGPVVVQARQAGNKAYAAAPPVQQAITALQAVLKVAVYNYTRVYATALPATFAYSISGFVNSDPKSVVSGTPSIATTAVKGSPVGSYPITPTLGSLSAINYSFQFTAGTLSVTPAVLKVAAYNYARIYATALPTTFAYSISGFVNGDPSSVVSGKPSITTTAVRGSPVGTYPITPALGSLSATNYTFQFINGALTIAKATLTVAAYNYSRAYGAALPTTFAYSISGFVNGDPSTVVSGKPSIATTAVQGSPVGPYPITPALGSLSATNYSFKFTGGTLTITKATLTVAAYNYTRVVGAALPNPFAYSITGFVNGDNRRKAVTGSPSITTTAKQGSPAGTYPITPTTGTLVATNYTFAFVDGTLTIVP